jgi:hypothetical protein
MKGSWLIFTQLEPPIEKTTVDGKTPHLQPLSPIGRLLIITSERREERGSG